MSWPSVLRTAVLNDGLLDGRATSPAGIAVRLALGGIILGAATLVGAWLDPWLMGGRFTALLPAIALITLLCGAFAGLVATAIATLICRYLFRSDFPAEELYSLALFVIVALADVAMIAGLLTLNARSKAAAIEAERLNAGLRASEMRFGGFIESAPDAIVIADREGFIRLINTEAERMFGYPRDEVVGQHFDMLMPERFRGRHGPRIDAFLANPGVRRMGDGFGIYGHHKDGAEFPIETNLSPLSGTDEGLVASVIRDLSGRKAFEERQTLLIRELNHRVKNTLASVQSIAVQTLRSTPTPDAFSDAFLGRITALSQSHDVLTRNDWTGALVRDVVAEQLSPYERGTDNAFRLEGPDVKLRPNRSLSLGMALGELATNAAKFGALSNDGAVGVSWETTMKDGGAWLRMTWTERGGPPVVTPIRRGFGSKLLERSVAAGLRGVSRVRFAADGLEAEFEFPLLQGEG